MKNFKNGYQKGMYKMSFIVAIDGPAGTGKGTITKLVSEELGLINIDTGAMYRCVTLDMINKGILESVFKSDDCFEDTYETYIVYKMNLNNI